MPKNTPIPQIEEICSGMKSATIPISESIITVIITIIMRIKNFLLSNFGTMGNILEIFFTDVLDLVAYKLDFLVISE